MTMPGRLSAILIFAVMLTMSSGRLCAQNVTNEQLLHPSTDSWPLYHGDYSGKRHSSLTQINPQNVGSLSMAWAFQTNQQADIKSVPLLVDGILYFSVPDHVWAVDARSGHMIWHHDQPTKKGLHIGHRGVALYKGWLYYVTPDAYLVSLNANDGTLRWRKQIADVNLGYWSTLSPLIVKNHVIVGVSGDFDNLTGFLRSFDPENGGDAVAVEFDFTCGNAEQDYGWHDVDDRNVRSGAEPDLLGNGESYSSAEWIVAAWR